MNGTGIFLCNFSGMIKNVLPSLRQRAGPQRICSRQKSIRSGTARDSFSQPPHMRGKVLDGGRPRTLSRDHPRTCGEKENAEAMRVQFQGSPPRMRGKGPVNRRTGKKPGITPACAGKSLRLPSPAGWAEDHPRMCGEKPLKVWLASSIPGSPPRMRGKAGQLGVVLIGQGSPPRMRGKA